MQKSCLQSFFHVINIYSIWLVFSLSGLEIAQFFQLLDTFFGRAFPCGEGLTPAWFLASPFRLGFDSVLLRPALDSVARCFRILAAVLHSDSFLLPDLGVLSEIDLESESRRAARDQIQQDKILRPSTVVRSSRITRRSVVFMAPFPTPPHPIPPQNNPTAPNPTAPHPTLARVIGDA